MTLEVVVIVVYWAVIVLAFDVVIAVVLMGEIVGAPLTSYVADNWTQYY